MGNRVSSRRLVGREDELVQLLALARRAGQGEGGAVVLAGDAGIGKSRLIGEFARRAEEEGARVLVGDCIDLADAELPYAPIVSALRPVVRERTEPQLDKLFGAARSELARLLPELGDPGRGGSGPAHPAGQTRLFELLLGVLSRLGQERPLVLVIEDVHWADSASLDLVAFLVHNQRSEPLATIVTFRSDELSGQHPVRERLAELERGGRARRIDLEPLSAEQVAEQVHDITGRAPAAAFSRALHDRGQGNPFFTEELLASGAGGELPGSLRDALLVRLRRLSARGREVVGMAAVAGRSVDHRLLAAVAGMGEDELIGALRDAVTQQVLISDGLAYTFRHALVREAVYADLVAGERAPVHAALARALTEHPALAGAAAISAAEIAHHWQCAGETEAALAASVRAGAEAERMYAVEEARRQYERVLDLWDRVDDPEKITGLGRAALLVRAAEAQWLAGDEPRALVLARTAVAEPDLQRDAIAVAGAQGRLAQYLWGAGDSEGALAAARRAVAGLGGDAAPADRARALCAEGRMLVMRGHNREARERLEEALAIARAAGARDEEGEALNYLGGALGFLGDYAGAIDRLRTAVHIARETGAQARGLAHYENLSEALAEAGQLEHARDVAAEGIAVARELGLTRSYGIVLMGRAALCALGLGRMADADELTSAALDLGPDTFFAFNALEARGRYEIARDDLDAAGRRLTAAETMAARTGDLMWAGPVAAARAELELWRGRPSAAAAVAHTTLALAHEGECLQHTGELHAAGLRALADVALAAAARRQEDGAARDAAVLLGRLEERLARAFPLGDGPPPRVSADVALCRAEARRASGGDDEEAWSAAVLAADAAGYAHRGAYARWRLAEVLLARSAHESAARSQAEVVLGEAAKRAAASGHAPLVREVQALARRARLAIAPAAAGVAEPPALGLTARETDVLRLLADGLTNKQIAAALYISDKTAEHHVSRILGKLGVTTRTAAGSLAHRLGIPAADAAAPERR
jgi:DNA-binding NarL/FixJ family response regulator/tetratricopeptide (TPR) repeat protein